MIACTLQCCNMSNITLVLDIMAPGYSRSWPYKRSQHGCQLGPLGSVIFRMYSVEMCICGVIKQNQSKVGQIPFSFFLTICMHHFHCYILQKIQLKLVNWFQRYEQLKDAKNRRKQKTFSALFGSILKSIFPTSCLITPHILSITLVQGSSTLFDGAPH